jgi:hypothetical protein
MRRPPIDAVTIVDLILIPSQNAQIFEELSEEIIRGNGSREIVIHLSESRTLTELVGQVIRQRQRLGLI